MCSPRPGLRVRAYDHHWLHDDPLGESQTDAKGQFQIHFTELRFRVPFETWPDLYVQVLDQSGDHVLHSTRRAIRKAAHVEEHYEITIPRTRALQGSRGDASRGSSMEKVVP